MLRIVGIGPGAAAERTLRAQEAILASDLVVGYTGYMELVSDLLAGKEQHATGMTRERERVALAIARARAGAKVALISSGDSGVYGMAGLALEMLGEAPEVAVEIIPGVTAAQSAAARLGAPLMLDFATVSLSDLLVDWTTIKKRITAALEGDFVLAVYNPRSGSRQEPFARLCELLARHRAPQTPVGICRAAGREEENVRIIKLAELPEAAQTIDMQCVLIIGNSTSRIVGGRFITPRGYAGNNGE